MARLRLKLSSPAARRLLGAGLGIAAIVSLFLLAAGLDSLELEGGRPFLLPRSPTTQSTPSRFEFPPLLLQAVVGVVLLLIMLALLVVLRSPRERKRVFIFTAQMLVLVAAWALVSILYRPEEQPAAEPTAAPVAPGQASGPLLTGTGVPDSAAVPAPPRVPPWLSYVVSLGVVLVAGALGYWLWRIVRVPPQPLQEIATVALGQLRAGRDWEDVVIQCYASMNTAVGRQRGLERNETATAREFAAHLEQVGLPADAVRRLTRLFEQARYGGAQSTADQVREATDCLSAIVAAAERRR